MATTDNEGDVRLQFLGSEKRREQMPFQMVDREVGLAVADGETLSGRRPDHERAGQSRTGCGGKCVHFVQIDTGPFNGPLEQARRLDQVVAGRNFRDYSAILLMLGDLGCDFAGQQIRTAQNRYCSVITRRFQCQDQGNWNNGLWQRWSIDEEFVGIPLLQYSSPPTRLL